LVPLQRGIRQRRADRGRPRLNSSPGKVLSLVQGIGTAGWDCGAREESKSSVTAGCLM